VTLRPLFGGQETEVSLCEAFFFFFGGVWWVQPVDRTHESSSSPLALGRRTAVHMYQKYQRTGPRTGTHTAFRRHESTRDGLVVHGEDLGKKRINK